MLRVSCKDPACRYYLPRSLYSSDLPELDPIGAYSDDLGAVERKSELRPHYVFCSKDSIVRVKDVTATSDYRASSKSYGTPFSSYSLQHD